MVTLEEARRVIAAAGKRAVEIKQPLNIAVVDEGGIPLKRGGKVVGGVGVSGGSGEQDHTVAEAGAKVF